MQDRLLLGLETLPLTANYSLNRHNVGEIKTVWGNSRSLAMSVNCRAIHLGRLAAVHISQLRYANRPALGQIVIVIQLKTFYTNLVLQRSLSHNVF